MVSRPLSQGKLCVLNPWWESGADRDTGPHILRRDPAGLPVGQNDLHPGAIGAAEAGERDNRAGLQRGDRLKLRAGTAADIERLSCW
jgi:hypothetical protein